MENLKTFFVAALAGYFAGWFIYNVLKKHTFGKQWGAIITGVIGSYLGLALFKEPTRKIMPDFLSFLVELPWFQVNLFAALLGAFLLVYLLHIVSPK